MRNGFKIFGFYFLLAIIGLISIPLGYPNGNKSNEAASQGNQLIWKNIGASIGYFYLASFVILLIFIFIDYNKNKLI
jgi:hypothetical protein